MVRRRYSDGEGPTRPFTLARSSGSMGSRSDHSRNRRGRESCRIPLDRGGSPRIPRPTALIGFKDVWTPAWTMRRVPFGLTSRRLGLLCLVRSPAQHRLQTDCMALLGVLADSPENITTPNPGNPFPTSGLDHGFESPLTCTNVKNGRGFPGEGEAGALTTGPAACSNPS